MAYSLALSAGFAVASNAGAGFSLPPDIAHTQTPARATIVTPAPIQSGFFEGRANETDPVSSDGARPLTGGPEGVRVCPCAGAGRDIGLSASGRGGGAGDVVAGASVRSMMIDATGTDVATGFGGTKGPFTACAVNARTSALGVLPCRARMSEAESAPAPANGASSSSQDGRNAVASRSKSSAVRGILANPGCFGRLSG